LDVTQFLIICVAVLKRFNLIPGSANCPPSIDTAFGALLECVAGEVNNALPSNGFSDFALVQGESLSIAESHALQPD
jgi:hypothetical protein